MRAEEPVRGTANTINGMTECENTALAWLEHADLYTKNGLMSSEGIAAVKRAADVLREGRNGKADA